MNVEAFIWLGDSTFRIFVELVLRLFCVVIFLEHFLGCQCHTMNRWTRLISNGKTSWNFNRFTLLSVWKFLVPIRIITTNFQIFNSPLYKYQKVYLLPKLNVAELISHLICNRILKTIVLFSWCSIWEFIK